MALAPHIAPATPERWDDLVAIMSDCAAGRKCWCAYWYLPHKACRAGWGDANREVLESRVKGGLLPGIIAYVGDTPAAWVSVAPRTAFDRLNRSKTFPPLDEKPVYAVNCFVVVKRFRRQGLTAELARAAADFAFARGAPGVEAYPVASEAKSGPYDLFLGTSGAFAAAGYVEVARATPRRPVMRKMRPAGDAGM